MKDSIELRKIISKNILKYRHEKGLSQEVFAFKCNLHRTYIGAIERGERNITIKTLQTLAETMCISVVQLLTGDNIEK